MASTERFLSYARDANSTGTRVESLPTHTKTELEVETLLGTQSRHDAVRRPALQSRRRAGTHTRRDSTDRRPIRDGPIGTGRDGTAVATFPGIPDLGEKGAGRERCLLKNR